MASRSLERSKDAETTIATSTKRVVVACITLAFLIVAGVAAIFASDADRMQEVGKAVVADNDRSVILPLERGRPGSAIFVEETLDASKTITVTLLDERVTSARHTGAGRVMRDTPDASWAKDFSVHHVMRISGMLDCRSGAVRWLRYEIADDTVGTAARTGPLLVTAPPDMPARVDDARRALLCEIGEKSGK